MNWIITSDLHLTPNINDEYRFEFLEYLCQEHGSEDTRLFILGDLTEHKDRHPVNFVNRVADTLERCAESFTSVHLLAGNHDGVEATRPFFKFMEKLDNIFVISDIESDTIDDKEILFLPHTRNPTKSWYGLSFDGYDYILMHHTFRGARSSNGFEMDGLSINILKDTNARIFSGDIHVPQDVGPVTYVGSPYKIKFGDDFLPRYLEINNGEEVEHHYATIDKIILNVSNVEELYEHDGLKPGDQVKIRFHIRKAEAMDWQAYRRGANEFCQKHGLVNLGVEFSIKKRRKLEDKKPQEKSYRTKEEALVSYCKRNRITKYTSELGLSILNE